MAGGGDVRIIGANIRVGEGVANVTDHELWVRLSSVAPNVTLNVVDMTETITVLSGSTDGRAIVVSAAPVLLHEVPEGFIDLITLYVSSINSNTRDDNLRVVWGNGSIPVDYFAPKGETRILVEDMPLQTRPGMTTEKIQALALNPFAAQSLHIIGRIRRFEL